MTAVRGDVLDSQDMFGAAAALPRAGGRGRAEVAGRHRGPAAGRRGRQRARARAWAAAASPATCWPRSPARSCRCRSSCPRATRRRRSSGPGTLCFAVSFSGNTEETLEAAQAAAAAGARMVVVTAGGELAALAPTWQAPHVPLPDDIPQPRAALGALSVPLILRAREDRAVPGRLRVGRRRGRAARGPPRRAASPGDVGPGDRPHDRPHDPAGLRRRPARRAWPPPGGRRRSTRTPRRPAFTGTYPRAVPQRDRRAGASTAT